MSFIRLFPLGSVSTLGQTTGYNLNAPGTLYPLNPAQTARFTGLGRPSHTQILSPTRNALKGLYGVYRVSSDACKADYWPSGKYGIVLSDDEESALTMPVARIVEGNC